MQKFSTEQLYNLARKCNPKITMKGMTKKNYIKIISENNKFDAISKRFAIPNKRKGSEYKEDLKKQIEYWKEQAIKEREECEKWKLKYIELLENKSIMKKENEEKIEKKIEPEKIKIVIKTEEKKTIINKSSNPFELLKKIDKKKSDKTLSDIIKENSLIDHINNMNEDEIKGFGYESRMSYFKSKLKDISKKKLIIDGTVNKRKQLKKVSKKTNIKVNIQNDILLARNKLKKRKM